MNKLQERLMQSEQTQKKALMVYIKDTLLNQNQLQDFINSLAKNNISILAYKVEKNLKKTFAILSTIQKPSNLQLAIILDFQKIYHYGIKSFIDKCKEIGIEGIRILNLPQEEQGQVAVYLLDEDGPALLQEITPVSGDRIPQILKYARGCVWCSPTGDTSEMENLGNPLEFYMYAVEATAMIPVMLDFEELEDEQIQSALPFASGLIVGKELENQILKEGYSKELVHQYCDKIKNFIKL